MSADNRKICQQPGQATFFMTLIECLISQAGASQVLVPKNSEQHSN